MYIKNNGYIPIQKPHAFHNGCGNMKNQTNYSSFWGNAATFHNGAAGVFKHMRYYPLPFENAGRPQTIPRPALSHTLQNNMFLSFG